MKFAFFFCCGNSAADISKPHLNVWGFDISAAELGPITPKTRVFSAAEILLRIYQNPIHLNGARWRTTFFRRRTSRCLQTSSANSPDNSRLTTITPIGMKRHEKRHSVTIDISLEVNKRHSVTIDISLEVNKRHSVTIDISLEVKKTF